MMFVRLWREICKEMPWSPSCTLALTVVLSLNLGTSDVVGLQTDG